MQHYFVEKRVEDKFYFHKDDEHHIRHVMRFHHGDEVACLFEGKKFLCRLVLTKDSLYASLVSEQESLVRDLKINLVQALTKGDSFELILQKATELGVSKIIPYFAKHSVVKLDDKSIPKKLLRWQKILKEASEQAERLSIPLIFEPCKMADLKPYLKGLVILADERLGRKKEPSLVSVLKQNPSEEVTIIIGPEGGFCMEEFDCFYSLGAKGVSLGPRILRAETAAIAALTLIMIFMECGR